MEKLLPRLTIRVECRSRLVPFTLQVFFEPAFQDVVLGGRKGQHPFRSLNNIRSLLEEVFHYLTAGKEIGMILQPENLLVDVFGDGLCFGRGDFFDIARR